MRLFRSSKKTEPPVPAISRTEALACTPVIVPGVSSQQLDTGNVLLEYPLALKPLLRAIFLKFNKDYTEKLTRKLQLDELGSQVWQTLDGKRNVGEVIQIFAKESMITNQEAELSVTTFLRELGRRGLIVIKEPKL